jgi:hypothetical protein
MVLVKTWFEYSVSNIQCYQFSYTLGELRAKLRCSFIVRRIARERSGVSPVERSSSPSRQDLLVVEAIAIVALLNLLIVKLNNKNLLQSTRNVAEEAQKLVISTFVQHIG